MKIELGKTYVNRKGFNVTIKERLENPIYSWLFKGSNSVYYGENGMMSFDGSEEMEGDLVREYLGPVTEEFLKEFDNLPEDGSQLQQSKYVQEAEDMVNSPSHYTQGSVECIDAIQSALSPEEFKGYLKGNVMKYIYRERNKGGTESLKKAQWYLNKIVEETE